MMMAGGVSAANDAGADVQAICDQVRSSVEEKAGRQFSSYTAVKVSKQVVAGTNYFVKIHLGDGDYLHVRIYQPLPNQGGPQVHSIQESKKEEDVLSYF